MVKSICCAALVLLTLVSSVSAQVIPDRDDVGISGSERRESSGRRESSMERLDRTTQVAGFRVTETVKNIYLRLAPSVNSGDASTTFGLAGHIVRDTTNTSDGLGYLTVRPSYRVARRTGDNTHNLGGGIGADVQLNKNSHSIGQFVASADYLAVRERYAFASGGLEWNKSWEGSYGALTAIGTVSVARIKPDESDSVSDVTPGLALDFVTPTRTPVRLAAEYTFENDVDGEYDFAFSMRIKVGDKGALRVGTGRHGRVFGSFTQTLDR
jgi:hypothetical protein